jgi:hypothetical protein
MALEIFLPFVLDKTIPQGASTTLYACLHPELSNDEYRGAYLDDCAIGNIVPKPENGDLTVLRQKFWEVTCEQLAEATKK